MVYKWIKDFFSQWCAGCSSESQIRDMYSTVPKSNTNQTVKFKKLVPEAQLPSYAHLGDSGMDLCAIGEHVLKPREWKLIPTGLAIILPEGHEGQIRPRSGLAAKNGITVLNTPGTIDSGFRNEIKVILTNHNKKAYTVKDGDRIAQMVIMRVKQFEIIEVEELDETERNMDGFGSTGV